MDSRFEPIGTIFGEVRGVDVQLRVFKSGRDFRLSCGGSEHTWHRSVRSAAGTAREAKLKFGLDDAEFVAD